MTRMVTLKWEEGFVEAIDAARGEQSRSQWLLAAARARLGEGEVVAPPKAPPVPQERVQAPAEKAEEVAASLPDANLKPASKTRYRCKVGSCSFTAPSPGAMCPIHPGKLISL